MDNKSVENKRKPYLAKQIWRLVFAQNAFSEAKKTAEHYLKDIKDDRHPLHYTFISSAVVTYSEPFIGSSVLGQLPEKFTRFDNPDFKHTHKTMLSIRNILYAHKDISGKPHKLELFIELIGTDIIYESKAHHIKMRGVIIPDLVALCEYQIQRTADALRGIYDLYLPIDNALRVLKAEGSNQTVVDIPWPK